MKYYAKNWVYILAKTFNRTSTNEITKKCYALYCVTFKLKQILIKINYQKKIQWIPFQKSRNKNIKMCQFSTDFIK